jgi:hypothetical protein
MRRQQNSDVFSKTLLEEKSEINSQQPSDRIWAAVNKSLTRSKNAQGDQQREKLARLLDHLTKTS